MTEVMKHQIRVSYGGRLVCNAKVRKQFRQNCFKLNIFIHFLKMKSPKKDKKSVMYVEGGTFSYLET